MRVHFGFPDHAIGAAAATIGSFDGIHRGHQELLSEMAASARDAARALVTFEPHPRCVLDPANCPQSITTLDEKLELVERCGVTDAIVLTFTRELANQTASDFMDELRRAMDLRSLVVGYDFALGRQRQGNVEWLADHAVANGYQLVVVPPVTFGSHELHSSEVRRLITLGDVDTANELLGREFSARGTVEAGAQIGRRLGFPTVNLAVPPNKLIPKHGIYAGRVRSPQGEHMGAFSVGYQPHFGGTSLKVEAYLLDFDGDLYQQRVELRFVKRLRDEARFSSEQELVQQIARDVAETRRLLGA